MDSSKGIKSVSFHPSLDVDLLIVIVLRFSTSARFYYFGVASNQILVDNNVLPLVVPEIC